MSLWWKDTCYLRTLLLGYRSVLKRQVPLYIAIYYSLSADAIWRTIYSTWRIYPQKCNLLIWCLTLLYLLPEKERSYGLPKWNSSSTNKYLIRKTICHGQHSMHLFNLKLRDHYPSQHLCHYFTNRHMQQGWLCICNHQYSGTCES